MKKRCYTDMIKSLHEIGCHPSHPPPYIRPCVCMDSFSRVDTIPACDARTDGRGTSVASRACVRGGKEG